MRVAMSVALFHDAFDPITSSSPLFPVGGTMISSTAGSYAVSYHLFYALSLSETVSFEKKLLNRRML